MKKANEGDLYKVVELGGRTFELRYGYYADYERDSKYGEPIPIYPNLHSEPQHTDAGYRIVTQMQALCDLGKSRFEDGCCADCSYFQPIVELFGICGCEAHRRRNRPDAQSAPTEDTL